MPFFLIHTIINYNFSSFIFNILFRNIHKCKLLILNIIKFERLALCKIPNLLTELYYLPHMK